ncbi:MAG: hypothetical protein QM791_15310 [Ferruginibacter sp.]
MKPSLLLLIVAGIFSSTNTSAQQINGVFTDFAQNNNEWGNTVINTATLENSGYITLGGYYEGAYPTRKMPLVMQINSLGTIRPDFGSSGVFLMSSVNSNNGSTIVDRTFIANTSSSANSNAIIVAGHEEDGDGFLVKSFPTGSRPTAFNGGQIATLSGGGASANGYIEDWRTGPIVYSIRMNGATFGNAKVLVAAFDKENYIPIVSFGDSGTVKISAPDGSIVDQSRPARIALLGTTTPKFFIAFSTIASIGTGTSIAVCCINYTGGKIDSSFGVNGYKTFPTTSRYNITSLLVNDDESVTVGGYGDEGQQSVPSFFTFKNDGSISATSFNYLLGELHPGFGSKNIAAKKTVINAEERIVFAYAHPINTNEQYRIAIASLTPSNGTGTDPLPYTPWLSSEFVSAEPTSIITLLNNAGFIVTGKATRADGTFAGIVLKYTINGLLDANFGTQGVLVINGRQGGTAWSTAAQLPNGKYLAVGNASFLPTDLQKKALILNRFNSNGSIDSSFGTNGTLYAYQSAYSRSVSQLLTLPNGQFLLGGSYYNYQNETGIGTGSDGTKATVYKFNADGTPDNSFGPFNNGRYHFPGYVGMTFSSMKILNDEIYMSGNTATSHTGTARAMILKLSGGGINTGTYLPYLRSMNVFAISETTGNVYVGGADVVGTRQICKVKAGTTNRAGLTDSSFGTNGLVNLPVINSGEYSELREIKIKPGSILAVVDWASATSGSNIVRGVFFTSISQDGVLDTNFGNAGAKFLQLPGASSIAMQQYRWVSNGNRLMIFGQATVNSATKSFVCKVDLNGDLDTSFGTNGVIWPTASFSGNITFDNNGNMLAIKDYGFFKGGALAKLEIPADVYNRINTGSWAGTIDSDWFKPGNWAEGVVPDEYTEVVISNGSVLIGANMHATAYSVKVSGGANLTLGQNATLSITKNNP